MLALSPVFYGSDPVAPLRWAATPPQRLRRVFLHWTMLGTYTPDGGGSIQRANNDCRPVFCTGVKQMQCQEGLSLFIKDLRNIKIKKGQLVAVIVSIIERRPTAKMTLLA